MRIGHAVKVRSSHATSVRQTDIRIDTNISYSAEERLVTIFDVVTSV